MFCKKCGGRLESYASHCAFCGTPVERYDTQVNYINTHQNANKGAEPMTVLKWFGLTLLPAIPLVGIIIYLMLMFKWAFGTKADATLKSYAKFNLILMLLAIISVIVLFFMGLSLLDLENLPQ